MALLLNKVFYSFCRQEFLLLTPPKGFSVINIISNKRSNCVNTILIIATFIHKVSLASIKCIPQINPV